VKISNLSYIEREAFWKIKTKSKLNALIEKKNMSEVKECHFKPNIKVIINYNIYLIATRC